MESAAARRPAISQHEPPGYMVKKTKSNKKKCLQPAVFLDRDGTINEQMGYINHLSRFVLLPGVAAAIRLLNENNIPVIVATNQSGLGRGYFPASLLAEVHEKMHKLLAKKGAQLDGIYVCPHHPESDIPEYRLACDCRKPGTGLLTRAAREHDLDLPASYLVGDRWTDIETAHNCRIKPILVLTGYGRGELALVGPKKKTRPRHVAEDLNDAVEWILNDLKKI